MEEDLTILTDSLKNCNTGDEKEKVKDFVYKHFREVADGSLFNNAEESSNKEHGSSSKKEKHSLKKAHCKSQQGAVFSGKILSFGCSVCKDDSTYSPNDLLKHFRAAHKGTLPTYPCDLCAFSTHEFPALQRHRIEHRNTLVTCELCNNDVQYSLLLLTRHYIMCHSLNGQFNCDWCEFTTVDADADIPEVANIMKVVNRNKGAVTKVSLSQNTTQALSEQGALWKSSLTKGASSQSDDTRPRPVLSSVRERFLLKMKLRKKSKKKYEVVDPRPRCGQEPVVFDCWFCGRLFNNQEDWIGHGQRHLMEATRDWNKLF
ncbi:hypothetical protein CgunFtcFv8_002369 [Champsocephalus gunnari]|uniref:C2H2-type domain-containing protein n=1 Tax=Champsocephalus gunnari TaxID=52237 RepID=A0AAN8CMH2_CHAGU|nr:hypothetical protein CgunFtcFv8_002369 [Champsocephalus gunnari]